MNSIEFSALYFEYCHKCHLVWAPDMLGYGYTYDECPMCDLDRYEAELYDAENHRDEAKQERNEFINRHEDAVWKLSRAEDRIHELEQLVRSLENERDNLQDELVRERRGW